MITVSQTFVVILIITAIIPYIIKYLFKLNFIKVNTLNFYKKNPSIIKILDILAAVMLLLLILSHKVAFYLMLVILLKLSLEILETYEKENNKKIELEKEAN